MAGRAVCLLLCAQSRSRRWSKPFPTPPRQHWGSPATTSLFSFSGVSIAQILPLPPPSLLVLDPACSCLSPLRATLATILSRQVQCQGWFPCWAPVALHNFTPEIYFYTATAYLTCRSFNSSMFFWLRKIFRYFSLYSLRTVAFYHVLVVAGKISKAISMDHTVSRSHSRWLWLEFEDSDLSQQNTNRSWEGKLSWFYFQVSQKITISYAKIICFKQYISVWQEKGCETLNKSNVLCTGWFNATVVLKPLWKAINCSGSHLGESLAPTFILCCR